MRAQWDRLDTVLDSLIDRADKPDGLDPHAIDRVTAAIGRLEEVERRLSDRSAPPTVRAEAPRRPGRGKMD